MRDFHSLRRRRPFSYFVGISWAIAIQHERTNGLDSLNVTLDRPRSGVPRFRADFSLPLQTAVRGRASVCFGTQPVSSLDILTDRNKCHF